MVDTPTAPDKELALDPRYKPAEQDSKVLVRFIGNTSEIAEILLAGMSPGQVEWAGRRLVRLGEQMQATLEKRSRDMALGITAKMPDVPAESILTARR